MSDLNATAPKTFLRRAWRVVYSGPHPHPVEKAMPESQTPPAADLGQLRRLLVQHFSANDLRSLCQDLGVAYDVLPGEGTDAKARELITFMRKRGRLADLRRRDAGTTTGGVGRRRRGVGRRRRELPARSSSPGSPAAADAEIREVAQIGNPLIRAWRGASAASPASCRSAADASKSAAMPNPDEETPRR